MQAYTPFTAPRFDRGPRLFPAGWRNMTLDGRTPERAAAEWFVLLREEPDDEGLKARFAEWLAADPRHAAAWAEMGETAQAIRSAPRERRSYELPPTASALPRRRTNRWRGGAGRLSRRSWRTAAVGIAAACAFALALPSLTLRLEADHISGAGEVETVRLDDGSTVTLGPDSAIAVDYAPDARNVRLLSGQAMFEVTRNPSRPFRVAARDVTTTVLGTGFDVRMIGEATTVAVVHGRVRVDGRGAGPAASRELTAGEWVRVVPDAGMAGGEEAPELIGQWRSGKVLVRNRRIAEAIEEMRPWYKGKIVLADGALGEKLVTGTYDFRDPVRSLGLLVAPYGGRVVRLTPWLLIVTKS